MSRDSDAMNNLFALADTIGIDLYKKGIDIVGKGTNSIIIDNHKLKYSFEVVDNFRLPKANVGLVLSIKNWGLYLVLLTTGTDVIVILSTKPNEFKQYTGGLTFNIKNISGIIHKATRPYNSDEWKSF